MDFPSNSLKLRGIIMEPSKPHYVRIKYAVWPEIYGEQTPIPFPTLKSALLFAQNNCTVNKPLTRVFNEDGLVKSFTYKD